MELEKINVNLPEGYDGKTPITLIVREGDAESIKSRAHLNKKVTVLSIAGYIDARVYGPTPKENTGLIVYSLNPKKPTLEFIENPNDSEGTILSSALTINPDLLDFRINDNQFFSQKELEKLVRKNAHCFASLEDAKSLITNLQNFQVKYTQTVERADNRQGETKNLIETSIEQNKGAIKTEWNLDMPLFVATKKVAFTIAVEIEKRADNLPGFGFYSMDLPVLQREAAENTIMKEVNELKKQFAVVEVE